MEACITGKYLRINGQAHGDELNGVRAALECSIGYQPLGAGKPSFMIEPGAGVRRVEQHLRRGIAGMAGVAGLLGMPDGAE